MTIDMPYSHQERKRRDIRIKTLSVFSIICLIGTLLLILEKVI
mgnify:CR=1 FL=1